MAEKIVPCFPLNLVAFPGEMLNLHIFEPRYKQLVHECDEEEKTFIICPHYNGKNLPYGTEMKLIQIAKKYKNGKMDIRTEGLVPVKINAFYQNIIGKLYPGAEVEYLPWDDKSNFKLNKLLLSLIEELYTIMAVENVDLKSAALFRTSQVAHKVGFSFQQEIEFLKLSSEVSRQQYMIQHIEHILPIVKEMEAMKNKARLNGHFKNVIPPKF
jgi:Lon protease-like protein